MNTAFFLINTVFDLYLMVVLLRLWLQWARADFYNPLSQTVVKLTSPLLIPLRRVIPSVGNLDLASVVLALAVAMGKLALLKSLGVLQADWLSLALFAGLTVLKKAGSMVFWILLIRAILSWVSQGRNPIEYVMHQLTEPFLQPIRRILPSLGGLDLSVLVAFIALQAINYLLGDLFGQLWWMI
ncbi:integral membrane protein [Aeromonas diversa CDC 2478-85]|uniref:Integral membrane protein n=1 Tax=Aeromonas diversa CDC 2478-85 TaxID=1268237 RepID=N9VAN1_9GAMM|nr:YggT family protein [Aeromonas diversa]ENY72297.1 integral membrane protein [Aeromonas diversa CDC 2478-85]